MLKYLSQTARLRELYSYPEHPEASQMLPRLVAAYSSELGEVLSELKSQWAWWPGKPIDREKLLEETADVLFFHLLFVLHAQQYCYGFSVDSYAEHFKMAGKRSFGIYDLKDTAELTIEHLLDYQADINRADRKPYHTLYHTAYSFWTLVVLLGFSPEELERAFIKKFLTNIKRTNKDHTPEGMALEAEMQALFRELEISAARYEQRTQSKQSEQAETQPQTPSHAQRMVA